MKITSGCVPPFFPKCKRRHSGHTCDTVQQIRLFRQLVGGWVRECGCECLSVSGTATPSAVRRLVRPTRPTLGRLCAPFREGVLWHPSRDNTTLFGPRPEWHRRPEPQKNILADLDGHCSECMTALGRDLGLHRPHFSHIGLHLGWAVDYLTCLQVGVCYRLARE